jgi:hypothetical protein
VPLVVTHGDRNDSPGYSEIAIPDTMIASKPNFSSPLAVSSKMLLLFGSYRQCRATTSKLLNMVLIMVFPDRSKKKTMQNNQLECSLTTEWE